MLKFMLIFLFRKIKFFTQKQEFQLETVVRFTFFHQAESKVLQYFANMKHNLASLDAFAMVVKMINHTGQ